MVVLGARRVWLARRQRRVAEAEQRLRPLAFALLEGEPVSVEGVETFDARVLAALLARYSRRLRGEARERIAGYFEQHGVVAREVAAMRARRGWRRASAAYALGDMGARAAAPALVEALGDRNRDVRSAAVRGLGRLGVISAVPALVEAFAHDRVPRSVAGAALVEVGDAAVPLLRPLLVHPEPEIRASAAELVGLLGSAAEADMLSRALRDSSAEVRARAAHALGRVGAHGTAAQLQEALEDRIPFVRAAAARALGTIGDRTVVARLIEVARTDSYDPAHAAAAAVARLDPRALADAAAASGAGPHLQEAADLVALSAGR